MTVALQEALKHCPLFRELDDEQLTQVLMVGATRHYEEGATLLTEGATGGRLQIIERGSVRISKIVPGVGEEALTILGPGDFFGEVEFLDGAPASAHAFAHTDCDVFDIPYEEVRDLMTTRPDVSSKFLWAFARTLAGRLRATNDKTASILAISKDF